MSQPYGCFAEWLLSHRFQPAFKEHCSLGDARSSMFQVRQEEGINDPPTPDIVIELVTGGEFQGTVDKGFGRFRAQGRSGEFCVSPDGIPLLNDVKGRSEFLVFAVPGEDLRRLALEATGRHVADFGRLHAGMSRDRQLATLMEWMWDEAQAGSPGGRLFADGALLMVLGRLLSLSDGPGLPSKGGLAPWQVRRVSEFLEDHLELDPTLAQLSALVGLSTAHFCRAFKQAVGVPPHRYLLERRAERAKALMTDPRVSLAEIALSVGYANQSTFGTAFRKVTGVSPGEWRRRALG